MNKPSIIFILLVSLLSFSLISVSAQIIDVTIDGNSSVYVCYPYDYNVTLTNTSSTLTATNINYTVSLPPGFTTSDPLVYNISSLGPGLTDKIKIRVNTLCNAQVGNISVSGGYDYNNSSTTLSFTKPITVYQGAVTIEKIPSTQNATLEENVSWTITVKSTGLGPIENVVVTDILQPGLEYISSSPAGVVTVPGTIQWASNEIPALYHMEPNDQVQIQISAKVIGCNQLYDSASVTWGSCGVCQTQETIASIAFQPNPPKIDYTVPSFNINYCGIGNTFTIPITNTGGKAYDFNLSADFGSLTVANITSPAGASYSGGKFILGDIPNGTTNLTFDLVPSGGWCGSLPSGTVIFRPEYLYCEQPFYPPVKFGSYSVSNIPSISVSKTGAPAQMYLGGQITYNITASYSGPTSCGSSSASNIVVVDTIPTGFAIVNAGGGSVSGNTITWNVTPAAGLNTTIVLQSPTYSNCEYCYTTAINNVTATVTDCCGCVRTASASQSTILECSETVTSNKIVTSNYNFEKCTPLKYVNTFDFSDISFWDDVNVSALKFREEKPNNQVLQGQVKIDINGCVVYYTPPVSTYLDINFSNVDFSGCFDANTTSIRNTIITIEYNMSTQNTSSPSCGSGSFFDWSILDTGKIQAGSGCYQDAQQIRIGTFVPVNDSQMGISITGLPPVVDKCGTYDIELVLNRSSSVGAYDVEAVFPLSNYHINSISYVGHTPLESNNSPADFVWRYGDYFATNTQARILMNVTKKCTDQGGMSASLYWDGLCNRDGSYDRECQDGASQSPLVLSGNVCLMKVPELIWATTNKATWRLCLTNAGSGASYNIWLEDVLGPGLSYNSSSGTYSQLYINQDRNGNPINGATWIIDKINAGEQKDIYLTANIDSCTGLTNLASTSAGCLGGNCQPIKTDTASVRIPSNSITTNIIPATINMCDEQTATVIVKNTGLTYVYDVNVTASLPTGISYVVGSGNPSEPENVGANPVRWTKSQIPGLGAMAPSSEIAITFRIRSSCSMPASGTFTSQATYLTPCNDVKSSPQANSQISRRTPTLAIAKSGRNHTTGSSFANNVAAEPGDVVEWRLTITNSGAAPATNVEFYDVLPTNMTFGGISTSQYPAVGTIPSGSGTSADPWKHGTLSNVSGSNTATYYVWGTVNAGGCEANRNNTAYVRYGCDDSCRFGYTSSTGTRSLRTRPNFVRSQTIGTFTTCDGIITINLRNDSGYPTAYNVFVTSTLPPGYIFDSMITGPDPIPNPPSNPSQPIWSLGNMAASGTNTVLQFKVINDGLSCGTVTPGTNNVRIDYQDSCGNQLNVTNTSSTINPLKPTLSVSKTPVIQPVPPGGTGNWTITVTNTGNSPAYNVTVIDTLSADWEVPIVAGNGTNGEVPTITGNTITWQIPGPIAQAGGTWSATLSARLKVDAGTGTNGVIAVGKCSNGCIYSSATANARIINIQGLFKESEKEKATIGEEVVFDLAVIYSGVGSNYSNTTIIDRLPDGIEYVSHTYTDTYGGTIQQYSQNGQVLTWKLGTPVGASNRNFIGPNNVLIKITGRIKNILPDNVRDVILVNNANTSFIQDGASYNISDLDDVRIVEPNLTIEKLGDKTEGLPGDNIHYTITVRNIGNSSAYDVVIQDQVPSGLILVGGSITSSPLAYNTMIVGDIIQWEYLSIPQNTSVILEYDATIPAQGGSFTNTVTNTEYWSLPSGNNGRRQYGPLSDTWNVISPGTDLQKVTLNTDINVPSPGGIVYFRLTITNTGAMALNPVKLIDYLPDGLTYRPGYSIVGGVPYEPDSIVGAPQVLTWDNIGIMNPTDVIIVEFQATVDPGRTGTFTNQATVIGTSRIGDVTDSDTSNVGVKGPAINITKSVEPPWGKNGFNNEYTLVITNTGEVILDPVAVTDTLPVGLTYANLASIAPDNVLVNANGTTTITWNNIGPLLVGESKTIKFSAKFNGLENKSINYVITNGTPPNGDPVSDDDQVEILKHPGSNPRETLRIITKGYMKRCDLCYTKDLIKEARELITNQNIVDEDNTCCRPDDIIEELKIEIIKNGLDKDPRYLRALKLLEESERLCREANEAFDKGNYGLAQRLTKEKCEAISEAMRLMIEVLSSK
ncbi:MAG: NPCBM-associated, NEW3 domain of alpha-galactosidase [Candidatus Methanofastidiosum methylothiophilum]|uniref:NPCBM-associated, NEW3 domain of alpha-galactosidase n=1 Tax=Candidatus Methanofastidiosum methylothiophilum TaxID=1705564 RepID=A0A150IQ39_9EURY|nr:MAG: NPCBM-associated, NEW3 domain of alpha-galactosidase [Candidatus Methanofastidiosum methylthiophilus]KYC47161.1 MAG: NPCBM-associated, NEW3 domain of alpha-galactosidase [Candidatus Methanofastidiosum methylthiophilus]KYC49969.1 MAG: NPCBM-associated, NEW3 domain of alpha-galactosidase [Candidatus Methanofastidiosum methylthiophilus]